MKTKIKHLLVFVLASFVLVGCCTTHSKTAQLEYRTARFATTTDFEAQLNNIAKDGWKLLMIEPEQPGYSIFIFERPKQ